MTVRCVVCDGHGCEHCSAVDAELARLVQLPTNWRRTRTHRPAEAARRGSGRESDIAGQTDRAGGPGVKEARLTFDHAGVLMDRTLAALPRPHLQLVNTERNPA